MHQIDLCIKNSFDRLQKNHGPSPEIRFKFEFSYNVTKLFLKLVSTFG